MKITKYIEFYFNGTHIFQKWYNDNIILFTEDEIKNLKNKTNQLLTQPINTSLGKKTYLGKLSNLPRHKIKTYFEENKIKKTSRIEQSDTIILNKDYLVQIDKIINKDIKLKKIYDIEDEKDKLWLIDESQNGSKSNNMEKINQGYKCFFTTENSDIIENNKELESFLNLQSYKEHYVYSFYKNPDVQEILNHLIHVIENPHVNVVFDEYLLENINKDGFNFDEDYLSILDNMFESKTQDNINLALEMLSNINIEKYSLNIALFLNKHMGLFEWGSGLTINQHKSFKSILKYFKSKNIHFNTDWRSFSNNLHKLHKDNPENVKIINEFIRQNINKYLGENSNLELNTIDIKYQC